MSKNNVLLLFLVSLVLFGATYGAPNKTDYFKDLLRGHCGDAKPEIQEFVNQIRRELGLKKEVHVKKMRVQQVPSYHMVPMLLPVFKFLVIDEEFFESLTDQEKRFFIGNALLSIMNPKIRTTS